MNIGFTTNAGQSGSAQGAVAFDGSSGLNFVTTSFGLPLVRYASTFSSGLNGVFLQADRREVSSDGSVSPIAHEATQIVELREMSGLTIDQLGRLFGVSRRSVHNWMKGKPMAPRHEERLGKVLDIVRSLPGTTSQERRKQLLASREHGSIFQSLMSTAPKDATIQVVAVSPKDLMQL